MAKRTLDIHTDLIATGAASGAASRTAVRTSANEFALAERCVR